jgi:2-keto-3-deoxy-galactonokinase
VLIGAELAALPAHPGPVVLAGSPDLTTRYLDAAQVLGLSLVAAPPDCVVAGQMEVFRKHGI